MNASDKKIILLAVVVFLFAAGIYVPTLRSTFIWDDLQLATHPLRIGSNPYAFFFGGGAYYRPFLHLSMAIDFGFWHLNPMGYHTTNILLHGMNSLLVFFAGIYLLRNKGLSGTNDSGNEESAKSLLLSFISALFFALHPIHTESVAWISGRTDMLSTFFVLLAFLSYLIYDRDGKIAGLFLCSVFFLFSLFSKENAISFFLVVLAYATITKMARKKIVVTLVSLLAAVAVYMVLRQGEIIRMMMASPGAKGAFLASGISSKNLFAMLSGATGYYIEKLVLPFDLNLLPQIPEGWVYLLISLLPFVLGGILYYTGCRLEVFLIAWIVVTLLPSLSILLSQIGAPIGERYLYLPSVGFSLLAGAVLVKIKNRKALFAGVFLLLSIYSVSTYERLKVWKNDETLWEDTVAKNPSSSTAHANYGRALLAKKESEKGKNELLIALRQEKVSPELASNILDMLGTAEMNSNSYEKAESYFMDSLKANARNAAAYNNLGILYLRMSGSLTGAETKNRALLNAIRSIEYALTLSPGFIQARFNLGLCYMQLHDYDRAESNFKAVLEADPRSKLSSEAVQFLMLIEFARRNIRKGA